MQSSSSLRKRWSSLSKRDKDLLATAGLLSFAGAAGASALYFAKKKKTKSKEVSMDDLKKRFIEALKAASKDNTNKKKSIDAMFAEFAYSVKVKEAHKHPSELKLLGPAQLKTLRSLR